MAEAGLALSLRANCPGESAQALESDSGSNSQSSAALGHLPVLSGSPSPLWSQGDWEPKVGGTSPALNTDLAPGERLANKLVLRALWLCPLEPWMRPAFLHLQNVILTRRL